MTALQVDGGNMRHICETARDRVRGSGLGAPTGPQRLRYLDHLVQAFIFVISLGDRATIIGKRLRLIAGDGVPADPSVADDIQCAELTRQGVRLVERGRGRRDEPDPLCLSGDGGQDQQRLHREHGRTLGEIPA